MAFVARLAPDQARDVLRRLLERRPELLPQAAELMVRLEETGTMKAARASAADDVAQSVCSAVCSLELEDLTGRAGAHSYGYVGPGEVAWELLEESVSDWTDEWQEQMRRGEIDAAVAVSVGIVTGLYRARSVSNGSDGPLGWAADFPIEYACSTVHDLILACPKGSRQATAARFLHSALEAAPDWEDALRRCWVDSPER